jgi:hypothetical protein
MTTEASGASSSSFGRDNQPNRTPTGTNRATFSATASRRGPTPGESSSTAQRYGAGEPGKSVNARTPPTATPATNHQAADGLRGPPEDLRSEESRSEESRPEESRREIVFDGMLIPDRARADGHRHERTSRLRPVNRSGREPSTTSRCRRHVSLGSRCRRSEGPTWGRASDDRPPRRERARPGAGAAARTPTTTSRRGRHRPRQAPPRGPR